MHFFLGALRVNTLMVFLKDVLEKVDLGKKSADEKKNHAKFTK